MSLPSSSTVSVWILIPLALYVMLFILARRPVALTWGRIGKCLVVVSTLGAVPLLLVGQAVPFSVLTVPGVCLVVGCLLWPFCGSQLVRISHDGYLDLVRSGSKRLLLRIDEDNANRIVLIERQRTETLRVTRLSRRVLFARLPSVKSHDKITLLVRWLLKSFHGPLPRVRIVLKKRK